MAGYITKFYLLVLLVCGSVVAAAGNDYADLPSDNSLKNMQIRTAGAWSAFERKAFLPMLEYYFNRRFTTDSSKQSLYELTLSTENTLKNIHSEQLALKIRIEQYEGDDWDVRYGKNGMWRGFDSLVSQTSYLIAKCLYYRAITQAGDQQRETISTIFERTASIEGGVNEFYRDMLEAQVYMLERKSNEKVYDLIFSRLDAVEKHMSADTELYYDMWICRLNLIEPFSANQLNKIIDNFKSSQMADSPAIAMRLAFLQLQTKQSDMLQMCLNKWPQLSDVVADMIYRNIKEKFDAGAATQYITDMTLFEKELAAFASIHKPNTDLETLITSFGVGDQYPSRVLYYSAAVCNAVNSPKTAVDCADKALIQPAVSAQIFADVNDITILTVGAKAGYSLIDSDYREKVLGVFDRYIKTVGDKADPQLVFSYASAMKKVRPQQATELLTEIYKDKGAYSDKALFELLIDKFNNGKDISDEITALYGRVDTSDTLFYSDVTDLYCRHLAGTDNVPDAMDILDKAYNDGLEMDPSCGVYVLRKFLEKAEQIVAQSGSNTTDAAVNLAGNVINNESDMPVVRLLYIETAVLAGWTVESIGKMPEFSESFDTLEFSRAKARYQMCAGDFYQAAFVWGKIAKALAESSPLPVWNWQRAKYYQIYCNLKSEKIQVEDIFHSIEVLQVDNNWIAGYWADRLKSITPKAPEPVMPQNGQAANPEASE